MDLYLITKIMNGIREALSFVNDDAEAVLSTDEVETLRIIVADFLEEAGDLLAQVTISANRIGNLIVYEAEGHGTGFWDEFGGEQQVIGEQLSEIARKHFKWESIVHDDGIELFGLRIHTK